MLFYRNRSATVRRIIKSRYYSLGIAVLLADVLLSSSIRTVRYLQMYSTEGRATWCILHSHIFLRLIGGLCSWPLAPTKPGIASLRSIVPILSFLDIAHTFVAHLIYPSLIMYSFVTPHISESPISITSSIFSCTFSMLTSRPRTSLPVLQTSTSRYLCCQRRIQITCEFAFYRRDTAERILMTQVTTDIRWNTRSGTNKLESRIRLEL